MHASRISSLARLMLRLCLLFTIGVSVLCPRGVRALSATSPSRQVLDPASTLSRQFRCPEQYSSDSQRRAAVLEFIREYMMKCPENNSRDLIIMRYRLLVAHSCIQTLKTMLTNVGPMSEMLRFEGDNLGPRTEEYDRQTKVWTVWFRKDGEPPGLSAESLTFNFYESPGTTPESVAAAFVRSRRNLKIVGKFEAPDELAKKPAFFILSETLYPDETYGYVNYSKISSVGRGAYTVTLSRKISGTSTSDIRQKGEMWFLTPMGQEYSQTLSRVGVDKSWEQYFASKALQ